MFPSSSGARKLRRAVHPSCEGRADLQLSKSDSRPPRSAPVHCHPPTCRRRRSHCPTFGYSGRRGLLLPSPTSSLDHLGTSSGNSDHFARARSLPDQTNVPCRPLLGQKRHLPLEPTPKTVRVSGTRPAGSDGFGPCRTSAGRPHHRKPVVLAPSPSRESTGIASPVHVPRTGGRSPVRRSLCRPLVGERHCV